MSSGGTCHYCKKWECECFPEVFMDDEEKEIEETETPASGNVSADTSANEGCGCLLMLIGLTILIVGFMWAAQGFPGLK